MKIKLDSNEQVDDFLTQENIGIDGIEIGDNVSDEKINSLLDIGISPDFIFKKNQDTLFADAVKKQNIDRISFLLERGANIHQWIDRSNQAIHIATKQQNLAIVELLIDKEAQINQTSAEDPHFTGMTPLHFAVLRSNLEIAIFLIENGADINAPSNSRYGTPLDIATKGEQRIGIAAFLIGCGAKNSSEIDSPAIKQIKSFADQISQTHMFSSFASISRINNNSQFRMMPNPLIRNLRELLHDQNIPLPDELKTLVIQGFNQRLPKTAISSITASNPLVSTTTKSTQNSN